MRKLDRDRLGVVKRGTVRKEHNRKCINLMIEFGFPAHCFLT